MLINDQVLNPIVITILLITAFIGSGIIHVLWLRHPFSKRFDIPIDNNNKIRGKPIFGRNKTFRGFMAIVPATGIMFVIYASILSYLPEWFESGTWSYSITQYGLLGLVAGFSFMLGELPNSFLKRQFGILPGETSRHPGCRFLINVGDRVDSIIGMLLVLSIVVNVPWQTWVYILIFGPGVHFIFSWILYSLKLKSRRS